MEGHGWRDITERRQVSQKGELNVRGRCAASIVLPSISCSGYLVPQYDGQVQGAYIKFTELIVAPPFPALLALFIALGFLWIGRRLALAAERTSPIFVAAGFIVAAGTVASAVHLLAWAGFVFLPFLRAIAWSIAVFGIFEALNVAVGARSRLREWTAWARRDRLFGLSSLVAGLVALGLGLCALGPATDADSLDYHLGVPLEWLRSGGAYPRADWMTARLAGVGDMLNLLGLAGGTDALGAAMQFGGLLACVVALSEFARGSRERVLAALFVLACPVPLFLSTSQKPQLLLVAATTVGLVISIAEERLGPRHGAMIGACLGFAVASKLSFLVTAPVVAVALLHSVRRQARPLACVGAVALVALAFALPQLLRNAAMYGDPFTPMLERLRGNPDPRVMEFAKYLKTYGLSAPDVAGRLRQALTLIAPAAPGEISTALGVGAIALVPALRTSDWRARTLCLAALASGIVVAALGQIAGRFLLEPYLWAGAAFVRASADRWKNWMTGALGIQGLGVAGAALFGAATLAPGALTPALRHLVMERAATGYSESLWVDRIVPDGAILLSSSRSSALAPRPFVIEHPGMSAGDLAQAMLRRGVDTLVVSPSSAALLTVRERCVTTQAGSSNFFEGVRNPFNRGAEYGVVVVHVEHPAQCANALRSSRQWTE